MAPTIGFAFTSVATAWLIKLDLPVSRWWAIWLIAGLTLSAACFALSVAKWPVRGRPLVWLSLGQYTAVLVVAAAVLIVPLLVGGLQYTVLRGNGTDSFNYLTMAIYLDREPLAWASVSTTEELLRQNLAYPLARELLTGRWTSSALLALTSHVGQIPVYRWDFGYSLLSLLLLFGVVYAAAIELRIQRRVALLVASACVLGFWGQFIVDARAVSQENSACLVVLFALLSMRVARLTETRAIEFVVLGLILASLAVVYVEILPTAVVGFALSTLLAGWRLKQPLGWLRGGLSMAGLALVLTIPLWPDLVVFARFQTLYATSGQNNWQDAYFPWLYAIPPQGIWGLGYIALDAQLARWFGLAVTAWSALLTICGCILSLAFVASAIRQIRYAISNSGRITLQGYAVAALTQAVLLVARGQLWAAGKAVSFGYPFFAIVLASTWLGSGDPRRATVVGAAVFRGILASLVMLWFLAQCGLGVYRIWFAIRGAEYPRYIDFHGEYRQHQWDVSAIDVALANSPCDRVWVAVPDVWATEYLNLALGGRCHIVDIYGARGRSGVGAALQPMEQAPDFILLDKANWWNALELRDRVVAENSEFALVQAANVANREPLIVDFANPDGVEADLPATTFFWLGGPPTQFTVVAPSSGTATLVAGVEPGPSIAGIDQNTLLHVWLDNKDSSREWDLLTKFDGLQVQLGPGLNRFRMQARTDVSQLATPAGDERPLVLGIRALRVELGPAK